MQRKLSLAAILCLLAGSAFPADTSWVDKSNEHAQVVLAVFAELAPEGAGSMGIDGLDEEITDLSPGYQDRARKLIEDTVAELERRLEAETDLKVRQDLGILIKAGRDNLVTMQLEEDHMLPYTNVNQTIFNAMRALIDPQVSRDRYPAAVVRMEKYAGLRDGYTPFTELAKQQSIEKFGDDSLVGPYRGEVEQDLKDTETFISGIEELLAGTDLDGWQDTYATLAGQLRDYSEWVEAEILPRARDDFRLPAVMYQDALKNWGVEASPYELIEQATKGYMDIRNEMEALAPIVAKKFDYDTNNYREVIARLKKDGPIDGDKLLDHYHAVLRDIEEIIVRENLVTLPERDAGIRFASAAETAAIPAPHLQPPRLIGNTGEYPYFVIPLLEKNEDGSWRQTDDTYEAGAWTLTAHEARPGHEMQFSSVVESGVSITRAVFAINSANIEGWGLYAEAIVRPYLPVEGQLISLQYRLMRAARMFLDPMLNLGLITPEEARRLIIEDIGIGESWAQNEIDRYTYRMPGQATAYYYGYNKMQALRAQVEVRLQDRFDQQAFHDFVLDQGMLPPEILKASVMEDFVPSQMN
ncbi:MAG: DUF885 family protein [Woeseiaceae bacterium]|nr:DUF885 family protein [Woeseiaceae bacterium]NIP19919.1 DUF885 family protein [Woeseiaceae bacterium]NIS88720.1 DUF885 family protein [Woeseiaceae bacterium]